jgi:hypothetical protein
MTPSQAAALRVKLTELFPDSQPQIDRCFESVNPSTRTYTHSLMCHTLAQTPMTGLAVPPTPAGSSGVPIRVYFKTSASAAAHSAYNTVAIAPMSTVRDVVKLVPSPIATAVVRVSPTVGSQVAHKNKCLPLEAKLALILWKRGSDGTVEEQVRPPSGSPLPLR